jgi:acetyl esterase/lipase
LASTVGTHFKTKTERPAFMILAYPVISMQSNITHAGSRQNLLGLNPSDELVEEFSSELQVSRKTPPTFLLHARNDKTVPFANAVNFEQALIKNKVPNELHLFEKGGHGFGMRKQNIPADNWPNLLKKWLFEQGLITD